MHARCIVVMGVSGCGKSTVGAALAQSLGCAYVEGDDFHPPDTVARMAAGTPLTDAARAGWLQALAAQLRQATAAGQSIVMSCSALKRRYRDALRGGAPDLVFVHLAGSAELLAHRTADRVHRYMPASLLRSQLDTLEPPQADEASITVDVALPVERIVEEVRVRLESRVGPAGAS